jgi:TolA-binding protein
MKAMTADFARGVYAGRLVGIACVFAALALGAGCAYFNTLYNAKKIFVEAEQVPKMKDGTTSPQATSKYNEVIKKCEALIATYPKSKYVDDAVLLIARCLYEQGEYSDAIARLGQLDSLSTDASLKAEGRLYIAKARIAQGDLEKAVPIIRQLVEENPKKASDETLFLLGTSLVKSGNEADAVKYLEMLAKRYPDSPYRARADLEAAELYAQRNEYDKAVSVYSRLENIRMADTEAIRYYSGLGKLYVDMGQFDKSIVALKSLDRFVLDPTEKAADMLALARAYAGLDSLPSAIDTYKSITASYPRSMFSAEAHFHLGEIYQEKLDSLQVAKAEFDQVPQQYAGSPFAESAIAKSSAITKLLKLRESLASGGGGDESAVQFDLAEVELLEFKNYAKAIEGYKKVIDEYPDSELAPKAAYAIAFIYDKHLNDVEKAREAYDYVVNRYPESQQAQYAREALERITTGQQP